MESLKRKDTWFIGLMLFALFFGAGNLIFPPFLGQEAGENFWPAMLGFVVTGVGLPLITVLAIALAKDGVQEIGGRVHPLFAVFFTVAVYLSIGPFFGIPRAANVAFEMSLKPFVSSSELHGFLLLAFTFVFFAFVYWVCLNPSKLVERIGSLLTPMLLGAIGLLVFVSFFKLEGKLGPVTEKYESAPFTAGFLEGYLTMDTIAALAFGIIVVNAFKQKNLLNRKQLVNETAKASLIAGLGLTLVYVTVGLLGAKMASEGTFENGGAILTESAKVLFGSYGMVLLGVIVTLACFTTAVGLVAACSQYFSKLMPAVSYRAFATIITLVSFMFANLGLSQIITISVPVLIVLYPITIVLVAASLLDKFFNSSRGVYIGSVLLTTLLSLVDGLKAFGFELELVNSLFQSLPLYSQGLGWVLPAVIGGLSGFLLEKLFFANAFSKEIVPDSNN